MPEVRYGYPLEEGTTLPMGEGAHIAGVAGDGTRKLALRLKDARGSLVMVQLGHYVASPIESQYVGMIPFRQDHSPVLNWTLQGAIAGRRTRDGWLTFPDALGAMEVSDVAVTPGDDYYRFRGILDSHAQRFLVEHNPANLRVADPLHARIEHIAHELSDEDRRSMPRGVPSATLSTPS